MMTEVATTLAGARKGRPSILRRWVGQALARNLSCLVVPGPEVALAHGLNLAAADMRIAATPRDATVLLVVGELSQKLDEATAVLYAQMPRPRAILVLGGSEPSSLPKADVSADLSQTELMEAATRLQRLLAEDAFAASPDDFDSSILQTKTEYVCPMHPEVVEDEPGSCPKCGMDLVAREAGGDADAGEHDHSGHGHGDHDHGDHDHGSSGFMSMVEVTKDLPRSADGLAMDWLEVPFGPCFPGLPGGLRLTLTLDGDGVTEGQATSLVAMGTPSEEVAVETFIERLAAATPLAPVSYRLLACRAIEQAAGLEPDPAVERGRAAALERERIASHLGWLAQLGRQLSFVWLTRRAAALQLETQRADGEQLVVLRPALQALIARLEACQGKVPLVYSIPRSVASFSVSPTQAISGWV